MWACVCDCGRNVVTSGATLRYGNTKSCGCLSREITTARSTIHGHAKRHQRDSEYGIYAGMLGRCYNPNNPCYDRYGGRGIYVCDRWRESFTNFLSDMGKKPYGLTLDRINNDGPYSPENCRWATRKVQRANQSSRIRWINIDGRSMNMSEAAQEYGINRECLKYRLDAGWDVRKALTTPSSARA